jgi:Gpi18-like mannosyltransferase
MNYFLLPWYETIEKNGVKAISGEYSNYSPPYLYLLLIASFFSDFFASIVLIKSVSIAFTIFSALIFSLIVFESTKNRRLALIAAFVFPLIPSVAANAAWWGQSDGIYTSLLLCAFLFSLRGKPFYVVFFFSLAFAFKAQSVFFLPYLLYLLLRKEVAWKTLLVIPVVYSLMMLPAWLAGRNALELAGIYLGQGNYYRDLSMNAPNPWALVERFTDVSYETGLIAGILLALAANLFLVLRALQTRDDDRSVPLFLLAATLLISPYLLPKMHDRYFYPADVFLALLAFIHPRCRYAALAIQAASLAVTLAYLSGNSAHMEKASLLGSLFSTYAVFELFRVTGRNYRASGALFPRALRQEPPQARGMPGAGQGKIPANPSGGIS